MAVHVRLIGTELPGMTCETARSVHVGVQRGKEVVDLARGDVNQVMFEFDVDVRKGRFAGPYIHGRGDERFIYLSWGDLFDGHFAMFRRAKLQLDSLDPEACDGQTIEGRLGLSDANGLPLCASVRPPNIKWTVR